MGNTAPLDLNGLTASDWGFLHSQPVYLIVLLIGLSLLPFVGMMVTSFTKIVVVLSITRQAIGIQQAPPNMVITGLALILTVYVMHPVGMQCYEQGKKHWHQGKAPDLYQVLRSSSEPLRAFLVKEASPKNVELFHRLAHQMRRPQDRATLNQKDFVVLVPAFIVSELSRAFQIGFLIFLPFLIVDMVVANILMALGMQMLSPTTISLPFKVLLFVMVDGWYLITKGLVLGYQ